MAKTYFGYKDRDVKNRFNWADVGVKVSQAIEKEAADREQRKADEAKAVRDIIKNARNKIPLSKNASLHNQIINTTNTQVQSLMSAYRDFKGGKGSQSQWVQRRQNMNDNIDNYLGLMTDFSTMYDKKIERQKNDDSLGWESEAMSQMQDFNDQTKWQVTNDEDDYAYMQRIGPDGEPLPGDENKVSLAIARKQIAMYYDKYDTQAGIKNAVDMFGVTKLAILKDGVFTREAIQGRKDWSDALQHAAQSELTNPFDRLSILEKDMRGKINYVFSKDEVGKTGINEDGTYNVYMKKDQITKILEPDFTAEQDDAIYTRFKDMVLTASDIKEVAYEKKVVSGRAASSPEIQAKQILNLDALIYTKSKEFLQNPNQSRYNALGSAGRLAGGGSSQFTLSGNNFNQALTTGDISSNKNLDPSDPQNSLLILYESMGGNKNNFLKLQKSQGRLTNMPTDREGTFNTEVTKIEKEVDKKTQREFKDIAADHSKLLTEQTKLSNTGKYASMTQAQKDAYNKLEARLKSLEQEAKDQGGTLSRETGGGSSTQKKTTPITQKK